uniref:Signal peptidase complex catalytic subunit SEC11 n=1 Tax=Hyaloperonospora arabidopsidis (strain Emoy2) TaxID=559515 RepID=M4BYK1_HYAAE
MVVLTALMIWKGLMMFTESESPVVVVLSGSMEPAFQRGDILYLDNRKPELEIGDIVVYKVKGREIPIVHRVLELHERASDGYHVYLTKGDNNNVDDRGLYAHGQSWLERDDIVGIARACVEIRSLRRDADNLAERLPDAQVLVGGWHGLLSVHAARVSEKRTPPFTAYMTTFERRR